jgi:hypothetical protein
MRRVTKTTYKLRIIKGFIGYLYNNAVSGESDPTTGFCGNLCYLNLCSYLFCFAFLNV